MYENSIMTYEWPITRLEHIFPTDPLKACDKIHVYFRWNIAPQKNPIYTEQLFLDDTYLVGNIWPTQAKII